jgi:hypothetical protein
MSFEYSRLKTISQLSSDLSPHFRKVEGRARLTNDELVKERTTVGRVRRSSGDPAGGQLVKLTSSEVDSGAADDGGQSGEDESGLEEHGD